LQQVASQKKKKLNIPVGDVKTDADYEKNVKPTYNQTETFVRYHRRMADEPNMGDDYFMDQQDTLWIASNTKFTTDKDVAQYLTYDAFESIIGLFERLTNVSKDSVSLVSNYITIFLSILVT